MEYTYGYLTSVGGGMWIVFPKGSDPETSYVFGSVNPDEAAQHSVQLTAAGRGENGVVAESGGN